MTTDSEQDRAGFSREQLAGFLRGNGPGGQLTGSGSLWDTLTAHVAAKMFGSRNKQTFKHEYTYKCK